MYRPCDRAVEKIGDKIGDKAGQKPDGKATGRGPFRGPLRRIAGKALSARRARGGRAASAALAGGRKRRAAPVRSRLRRIFIPFRQADDGSSCPASTVPARGTGPVPLSAACQDPGRGGPRCMNKCRERWRCGSGSCAKQCRAPRRGLCLSRLLLLSRSVLSGGWEQGAGNRGGRTADWPPSGERVRRSGASARPSPRRRRPRKSPGRICPGLPAPRRRPLPIQRRSRRCPTPAGARSGRCSSRPGRPA